MANAGISNVLVLGILMHVSIINSQSWGPGRCGMGEKGGDAPRALPSSRITSTASPPSTSSRRFPRPSPRIPGPGRHPNRIEAPPIPARAGFLPGRAAAAGVLQLPVPFHLGVDLLQAEGSDHRADARPRVVRPEQAQVLPRLIVVADPFRILGGQGLAIVQRGRPAQYGVTQVQLVDQDLAGG